MPNLKISELAAAAAPAAAAEVPVVSGAANFRVTLSNLVKSAITAASATPSSIGLSTVAVTGSYDDLSSKPSLAVTLTGNVTGTGTGAIATTIPAGTVTNQMMANMALNTVKARVTPGGAPGRPEDVTFTNFKTLLAIVPANIVGFDAQVRASRLDEMAVPTAALNVNSQKITSLATPTASGDAASKGYVDSMVGGVTWTSLPGAPTLATVAITGAYADLSGKPTLGTAAASATSDFATATHTHALSDIIQSSATTGQVPQWNGTAWVATTPSGGGGGGSTNASDLTSGTLADERLSSKARAAVNVYLWSAFR